RGLSPLEADRTHDRKVRHRFDSKRGFDVKQVHIAGEACQRKIITVRKKWIERSEYIVTRTVIARGSVHLDAQARLPGGLTKCVAGAGTSGPSPDVLATDHAGLSHRFQVPVDLIEVPRESGVEYVAFFIAACIEISRIILLIERVISGQLIGAEHLPLDS